MQKVSLQEAVKLTGKSESTLRRDRKKGKVSSTRDEKGHLQFDVSELQRAYGELKSTGEDAQSTEQGNDKVITGHDSKEVIALLENQVADLRSQLEKSEKRENELIAEKSRLLDLTDRLTLMIPAPKETEPEPEKARGWLQRLIGA